MSGGFTLSFVLGRSQVVELLALLGALVLHFWESAQGVFPRGCLPGGAQVCVPTGLSLSSLSPPPRTPALHFPSPPLCTPPLPLCSHPSPDTFPWCPHWQWASTRVSLPLDQCLLPSSDYGPPGWCEVASLCGLGFEITFNGSSCIYYMMK